MRVEESGASDGIPVNPIGVFAFDVLGCVVIGLLVHVVYGFLEFFSAEKSLLSPTDELKGVSLKVDSGPVE
eukprot:4375287-Heterocapsa_arctica.AAC.1